MPLFLLKFLPLIMKAVPFLKGNWKAVLPILGVLFLLAAVHHKNNQLDALNASSAQLTRDVAAAVKANSKLETTNTSLKAANASLAQAVIVSEDVRAAAYREARKREQRAAIALDDTKTKLKELENETPTCTEISRIDIGAACPLSVDLLRRAAAGDFD